MTGTQSDVAPGLAFTAGLRALADLLDEHDAITSYDSYRHLICVSTRDELLEVVRKLGGQWTKDADPGDYFGMTRALGGGVFVYVYAPRAVVCEAVVVGKQIVKRYAPDAPTVDVEQDIVEWRCPPSLLQHASV